MAATSTPPDQVIPAPAGLELPYPAQTRQAAGLIDGVQTDVLLVSFADKVVVTITQNGRLAQWLHVPLDATNPATENGFAQATDSYDSDPESDDANPSLLPMTHLTAVPTLGSADAARDTMGQLYARQIASAVLAKDPDERRMIVVGLGLAKVDLDRERFFAILELVLRCI